MGSPVLDKRLFSSETQLPGTNRRKRRQVVIGLDFGTAFTKVVIGESRQAYAVHFSRFGSENNPYLLPAMMCADKTGQCDLESHSKSWSLVADMKLRLLRGSSASVVHAQCVAYLALVLRYSRRWFFRTHADTYKGSWIDWSVNVGLPTENYHNEDLVSAYREITRSAWALSVHDDEISLDSARTVLAGELELDSCKERLIHPDAIGLFPEFVGQITGYIRSPQRQDGLHALMDVGAGTVDVTVFNVFEADEEDLFPVFAKSVKNLGAYFHVLHRLRELKWKGRWKPSAQEQALTDDEFRKKTRSTKAQLSGIDKKFRTGVANQLNECLKDTKERRDPMSRAWQGGVPVFLCGGGSNAELYSRLIERQETEGKPYRIVRQELPKPDRLKASRLRKHEFDRLSVAYGLSFDAFDIGEIVKEGDIEDWTGSDEVSPAALEAGWRACPRCRGNSGALGTYCATCGGTGWLH